MHARQQVGQLWTATAFHARRHPHPSVIQGESPTLTKCTSDSSHHSPVPLLSLVSSVSCLLYRFLLVGLRDWATQPLWKKKLSSFHCILCLRMPQTGKYRVCFCFCFFWLCSFLQLVTDSNPLTNALYYTLHTHRPLLWPVPYTAGKERGRRGCVWWLNVIKPFSADAEKCESKDSRIAL